jgi:hypothetical protein
MVSHKARFAESRKFKRMKARIWAPNGRDMKLLRPQLLLQVMLLGQHPPGTTPANWQPNSSLSALQR